MYFSQFAAISCSNNNWFNIAVFVRPHLIMFITTITNGSNNSNSLVVFGSEQSNISSNFKYNMSQKLFNEKAPDCTIKMDYFTQTCWKPIFYSIHFLLCWIVVNFVPDTLQWRHNECDSVSNHQPHDCLLNRLFRRRSKKTSKLRVTGLCAENSPGPVNSPHKGPVTRKMFPFDDVIMIKKHQTVVAIYVI